MKIPLALSVFGLVWVAVTLSQNITVDSTSGASKLSPVGNSNHPTPAPSPTPALNGFGAALAGITAAQLAAWKDGRTQFQFVVPPEGGLGPIFNGQSCQQCHSSPDVNGKPVIGGAAAVTETRFETAGGVFDLLHQSNLNPNVQDGIPFESVVVAHRKSIALFGEGFIEAIPDATIIAGQKNGQDGVFGIAAILTDSVTTQIATNAIVLGSAPNFVGRFGWKCQQATLLGFAGDALINELGVTNRFFTSDIAPYVRGIEPPNQAALAAAEPPGITPTTLQDIPVDPSKPENPQTNPDDADLLNIFMQLTALPPAIPMTAQAQLGATKFSQIGCDACHTPSMQTGPSNISPALAFKNVPLYSDLLLHDIGTGDGIVQAAALANLIRTAPLFGLRGRTPGPFLHDGRAATVFEAIVAHGNEAQNAQKRFVQLPNADQQAILAFLQSI